MADTHVKVGPNDKSGSQILFDNPGTAPTIPGQGVAVAKTVSGGTSGQVNVNSVTPGPVFNNPA